MRMDEEQEHFGVTLFQKQCLSRLSKLYGARHRTISHWLRAELGPGGRSSCKELAKLIGSRESVIRRWAGVLGIDDAVKVRRKKGAIYLGMPCKSNIGHVKDGRTPRYVKGSKCVYCSDAYNAERKKERRRENAKM